MISTKFYLDIRSKKREGSPLKLRISVKREAAFISLDLCLPVDQWDPVRQVIKKNCVNSRKLNEYISRRKSQIDDCIRGLILEGALVHLSATAVRDAVIRKLYPVPTTGNFMAHFDHFASSHKNERTKKNYLQTIKLIRKFDSNVDSLDFNDVNKKWIDDFRSWLYCNGCKSVNAINFYLRIIRAVFNDAIDCELTTSYPFRKIKIKMAPTKKRSLNPEELRSIFFADVPSYKNKYVDAFKLIFFLIGINTVDLLGLKKEDLKDGRVSYIRAKTKRLYSIKVEPEAQAIIDKYSGASKLLSFDERCSSYVNWAIKINKNIGEIMTGVTTYYARHSWATIAASLDIPKETIAAALGHGGHSVTDIYIDFDTKKVDEANRRVIDFVLYNKRD